MVLPALTRDYAGRVCANNGSVTYLSLHGADHYRVAARGADAVADWLADRFAGRPVSGACR